MKVIIMEAQETILGGHTIGKSNYLLSCGRTIESAIKHAIHQLNKTWDQYEYLFIKEVDVNKVTNLMPEVNKAGAYWIEHNLIEEV